VYFPGSSVSSLVQPFSLANPAARDSIYPMLRFAQLKTTRLLSLAGNYVYPFIRNFARSRQSG